MGYCALWLVVFLLWNVTSGATSHQLSGHASLSEGCQHRDITAPVTATYSYKAWCEMVHKQHYFHHEGPPSFQVVFSQVHPLMFKARAGPWYHSAPLYNSVPYVSGSCSSSIQNQGLPWTDIEIEELDSMINSHNIQLFDVRERDEIDETGLMPLAANIPLGELEEAFQLSDKEFEAKYDVGKPKLADKNVVFSCLAGYRSRLALETAQALGFTNARHYIGGWEGYTSHHNL